MRLVALPPVSATVMTDDERNRHDIQNQLSVICGFTELLLTEAAADDPRRGDLEEIRNAAVTALDLLAHGYQSQRRPSLGLELSKRIQ
jgi:hypothetical protein